MDCFNDETRRRYMEADYSADKEMLNSEYNILLDDEPDEPIEDRRSFMKWLLDHWNFGYCDG